jgi:hypothetical protein
LRYDDLIIEEREDVQKVCTSPGIRDFAVFHREWEGDGMYRDELGMDADLIGTDTSAPEGILWSTFQDEAGFPAVGFAQGVAEGPVAQARGCKLDFLSKGKGKKAVGVGGMDAWPGARELQRDIWRMEDGDGRWLRIREWDHYNEADMPGHTIPCPNHQAGREGGSWASRVGFSCCREEEVECGRAGRVMVQVGWKER